MKRLTLTNFALGIQVKNRLAVNLAKTDFTKQVNLQEVIDIKRSGSFQKLKRVLSRVFKFFSNLKQRKPMLLMEILDKKELNLSEELLILDNRNKFERGAPSFRNLKNDLNVIRENNIFKCKGRLENAPIPIEAKLPILIYQEHYLSKPVIWRKEYIVNLREYHSTKQKVSSKPMIKLKDLVLIHDNCAPRHL